jgi:hypothetical protein
MSDELSKVLQSLALTQPDETMSQDVETLNELHSKLQVEEDIEMDVSSGELNAEREDGMGVKDVSLNENVVSDGLFVDLSNHLDVSETLETIESNEDGSGTIPPSVDAPDITERRADEAPETIPEAQETTETIRKAASDIIPDETTETMPEAQETIQPKAQKTPQPEHEITPETTLRRRKRTPSPTIEKAPRPMHRKSLLKPSPTTVILTLILSLFLYNWYKPTQEKTITTHYALSTNPFSCLTAELCSSQNQSSEYYTPHQWSHLLSSARGVSLIFGERGMGKSTLRLLVQKKIEMEGSSLIVDITPERQSLNTFLPVMQRNMWSEASWVSQSLYKTPTAYWRLRFDSSEGFQLADFIDMVLGRGVTLVIDDVVAKGVGVGPPFALESNDAVELARFAGTYYLGTIDSLERFLRLIKKDLEFSVRTKRLAKSFRKVVGRVNWEEVFLVVFGIGLSLAFLNHLVFDPLRLSRFLGLGRAKVYPLFFFWLIWAGYYLYRRFSVLSILSSTASTMLSGVLNPVWTQKEEPVIEVEDSAYKTRVIPSFDQRDVMVAPFLEECVRRNIRWDSSTTRLKSFRRLMGKLGYTKLYILLDGLDETPLSDPSSCPRVVPRFVRTVLDHGLFELSMDQRHATSFLFFFPGRYETLVDAGTKEKGRVDKYGFVQIEFTPFDLIGIAQKRFESHQKSRRHGFFDLFCNVSYDELAKLVGETEWIDTPRMMMIAMRNVISELNTVNDIMVFGGSHELKTCLTMEQLRHVFKKVPLERLA